MVWWCVKHNQTDLRQWVLSACGHHLPLWALVGFLVLRSSMNVWSSLFFSVRSFLRADTNESISSQERQPAVLFDVTMHSKAKKVLSILVNIPLTWVGCSVLVSNSCCCKLSIWLCRFNSLRTGAHEYREKIPSKFCLSEKCYWHCCNQNVSSLSDWLACVFPPGPIWLITVFTLFCRSGKVRENRCIY